MDEELEDVTEFIPAKLTAGTTLDLRVELSAYPAPTWTATLYLRGIGGAFDIVGAADGSSHRLQATAVDTAAWAAGEYTYLLRVTDGANVHNVESGRLELLPDLAQAEAGFDGRSHNRRVLDAVEAVLEKRASQDQERYRINNRELYRTPMAELIRLRTYYRNLVADEERRARGRGRFRQVKVAMTPVK